MSKKTSTYTAMLRDDYPSIRAYPSADTKTAFLNDAINVLKEVSNALIKPLGINVLYLNINRGGIAVSGEVTMLAKSTTSDKGLHVWISASVVDTTRLRADGVVLHARTEELTPDANSPHKYRTFGIGGANRMAILTSTTPPASIVDWIEKVYVEAIPHSRGNYTRYDLLK